MESKPKRNSACHSENSLPNTIVIQLVSPQPQAMPIAVNAMPLLPAAKAPVEQQHQRRLSSLTQNSASQRASCPPQMPAKNRPEMRSQPRRSTPPVQFGNFARGSIQSNTNSTNQPPGQGRTVCYRMEYVEQPEDGMAPNYNPRPRSASTYFSDGQMEPDCCCCCCRCRHGRRWIPEPERFSEGQVPTRSTYDYPASRMSSTNPEDRRDQATNTSDEPQDLQSLKMICETLGRALVTAATAAVEAAAAQKSQSAAVEAAAAQKSSSPVQFATVQSPDKINILAQAVAQMRSGASEEYLRDEAKQRKTSFADSKLSSLDDGKRDTPELQPDGRLPVKYPKTPRGTLSYSHTPQSPELDSPQPDSPQTDSPQDSPRMSSGGVYIRSSKIIGQCQRPRSKSAAGRTPARKFPTARQGCAPARGKGFSGPSIRRRLPTEKSEPVKKEENPGPTSPGSTLLMEEQSEVPGPSVVASPTDP